MTRTLPWLKGGSPSKKSAPAPRSPVRQPKRRRLSTPEGQDVNTTGVSTPDRKAHLRKARTPSTSPPPPPPDQEPMREGYAADDIWVMVEDEFLATAQMYTQHLHHAEYQRLKTLASQREVSAMTRPVDTRTEMPASTKRQIERDSHRKQVAKAMQAIAGPTDDDEDMRQGDPQLAGLMDSPRKPAQILRSLGASRANTKAAAGYPVRHKIDFQATSETFATGSKQDRQDTSVAVPSKSRPVAVDNPIQDEDDESDDLDRPSRPRIEVRRHGAASDVSVKVEPTATAHDKGTNIFQQYAKSVTEPDRSIAVTKQSLPRSRHRLKVENDLSSDEDLGHASIKPRQPARETKSITDTKSKPNTEPEIPTFLF